jgi:hypothetical protein
LGRRNLTDEQKTYLIGKEYEAQKQTSGGNTGTGRDLQSGRFTAIHQNGGEREKDYGTAGIVAKVHGIGTTSVDRAAKFATGLDSAEKVSPGFKDAVLTGAVKAPKSVIAEIAKGKIGA